MVTITLKGREIPLLYTTWEMKQIQEEIAPMAGAIDLLVGRDKDGNNGAYGGAKQLDALGKVIRILGNAGLEEAGESADLTDKWILRALKPQNLTEAVNAVMNAFTEGMASEIPEKVKDGPVDVTLEEMDKKKEAEA
jgi:hypothetical protein